MVRKLQLTTKEFENTLVRNYIHPKQIELFNAPGVMKKLKLIERFKNTMIVQRLRIQQTIFQWKDF